MKSRAIANILVLYFTLFVSLLSFCQEDTVYRKKNFLQRLDSIQNWKIEKGRSTLTPFIAPSYSPEMKVTITAGGLYTFKVNPNNHLLSRSSVPFSIGYSTNGSLQISIKANIYGKGDKLRFTGEYWLKNMPDNYWGVGYQKARYTEVSDSTTAYHRKWNQFKIKLVYEVFKDIFVGFNYDKNWTLASEINPVMETDPDFLKHGDTIRNSGFGATFRYDSRDFPENAFSGFFIELSGTGYARHTRSNNLFQVYELDYRQYQKIVRKGSTLAWQIKTRISQGDVPWTDLSMIGTPFDLRGYPWGQYRHNTMAFLLAEYRYMLPRRTPRKNGANYGPFGFVVWTGTGSVGYNYDQLKYWIPNAGVGLRFEIQKRMNVRLDYGIGINSNAFYISFNEAF